MVDTLDPKGMTEHDLIAQFVYRGASARARVSVVGTAPPPYTHISLLRGFLIEFNTHCLCVLLVQAYAQLLSV